MINLLTPPALVAEVALLHKIKAFEMCLLQFVPLLRYRLYELLGNFKNLDNISIALLLTTIIFQCGKSADRWAVVCVPFLSTNSDLKLFLEEAHIDSAVESRSGDSYMCLYVGLLNVQLSASYTHPVSTALDDIVPFAFLYVSSMLRVVDVILLCLFGYSVATVLIPYFATTCSRQRARVVFIGSISTFVILCSSLMIFMWYKEKDFPTEKRDVVKAMLTQFKAQYDISFYIMLISTLLNIFIIKISFIIFNDHVDRKSISEPMHKL